MTPQEALDLITQLTDRYLGTKKDHENLDRALEVLRNAVFPKTENKT